MRVEININDFVSTIRESEPETFFHEATGKGYYCIACAAQEVETFLGVSARCGHREVPSSTEIPIESALRVWTSEGNICWNRTNAIKHLVVHKIHLSIDKKLPSEEIAALKLKTAESIAILKETCLTLAGKYGWKFGFTTSVMNQMRAARLKSQKARFIGSIVELIGYCGFPIALVENAGFRRALPELPRVCRKTIRRAIFSHSRTLSLSALSRFKGKVVTLTIDIGTVWYRYLGVCVQAPGLPPFLLRLVADINLESDIRKAYGLSEKVVDVDELPPEDEGGDGDDDGEEVDGAAVSTQKMEVSDEEKVASIEKMKVVLTGELCARYITLASQQLKGFQISVGAVTTDNGSNMLKAARLSEGPDGAPIAVRCACHSFQLIARAYLETMPRKPVWDRIESFANEKRRAGLIAFPKLQATRWNSQFDLVEAVVGWIDMSGANGKVFATPQVMANDARILLEELEGLRAATLACEAQDADMLTLLLAFSDAKIGRVWPTNEKGFKMPDSSLDERQKAVAKHVEKFTNRATIFLCCVLPIVEVTELIDYFSNNNNCEGLIAIRRAISRWLESPRFVSIAIAADASPDRLKEQFEKFNNQPAEQRKYIKDVSRAGILAFLEEACNGQFADLFRVVRVVISLSPTEAEVERLFRRVKWTVPRHRLSLHPPTVEALCRVGTCVAAEIDIEEGLSAKAAAKKENRFVISGKPVSYVTDETIFILIEAASNVLKRSMKSPEYHPNAPCLHCKRRVPDGKAVRCLRCNTHMCATSCVPGVLEGHSRESCFHCEKAYNSWL